MSCLFLGLWVDGVAIRQCGIYNIDDETLEGEAASSCLSLPSFFRSLGRRTKAI